MDEKKLSALEEQIHRLEQIRNVEIRHRGLSNLMADKMTTLQSRAYPADRLFRIMCLGDSLMTAVVDAVIWDQDGKKRIANSASGSRLGVNQAPPHLEYRCVPSQLYEKLLTLGWQGDIEFRRFTHPDFSYSGDWQSNPLIENVIPEQDKLGLPRFFDYMSPNSVGDSMSIPVEGRRYANVVYAKRFASGSFRIEVDGNVVREVNCPEGLTRDVRFRDSEIYSMTDVVDCREMLDLGDTGDHDVKIVATDVEKPVRIWGVEMWNTPSFVVMNAGKSGMNVNELEIMFHDTAHIMKPDIVISEISGNDASRDVDMNMAAYSRIIDRCVRSHVPILFVVPCLKSPRNKIMYHGRTLLKNFGLPYVDMQHQLEIEMEKTGNGLDVYMSQCGHLNTPGVEIFSDQLLLPFLNTDAVQHPMFKGDTAW